MFKMWASRTVVQLTLSLILVSVVLVSGAGEAKSNGKPASASSTTTTTTPPPTKPPVQQKKAPAKLGAVQAKIGVTHDQRPIEWQRDLEKGQKLPFPLEELDGNYKLTVKVTTANQPLHQVFLVLRPLDKESKKEVAFALLKESGDKTEYKLELDVSTINLKDTNLKSGSYELILSLGDFNIDAPLQWTLGEVPLKLVQRAAKPVNSLYSISYDPKPEIKHTFREPEPRPPMIVSNAFTALVLFPLILLVGLWIKIGINVANFPFSLSAILFHGGLVGMFGVYGLFWLKLTMFEAIKLMTIPGAITFLAGNRLLKHIAEQRCGK